MTRLFSICGLAVLVSLAACGGDETDETEQQDPSELTPDTTDGGATPSEPEADAGTTDPVPSICPGGEQPTAEVCDGLDNDCDNAIDEGCPSGIAITAGVDGPAMGNLPGGSPVTAFCPAGQVVTGFSTTRIFTNGVVGNLEIECGKVTLNTSTQAKPFTYSISFPLGTKLGRFGGTLAGFSSSTFTVAVHRCPTGSAVSGLRYHSNAGNATLGGMRCSSVTASGSPGRFTLTRKQGADTTFPEVTPSATAVRAFFDCAGSGFISGFTGRAGVFVDAMRASCANGSLLLK